MAVRQLRDYLETGSITNAVMFPTVNLSSEFIGRVCILHKSGGDIQDRLLAAAKKDDINPLYTVSKQKGEYGYTVFDTATTLPLEAIANIRLVPEVLRVLVL
jgi:D-3-phosphoglycerate dehydrogenase